MKRKISNSIVFDLSDVPPQLPIPKSSGRISKEGASKYAGALVGVWHFLVWALQSISGPFSQAYCITPASQTPTATIQYSSLSLGHKRLIWPPINRIFTFCLLFLCILCLWVGRGRLCSHIYFQLKMNKLDDTCLQTPTRSVHLNFGSFRSRQEKVEVVSPILISKRNPHPRSFKIKMSA